MRKAIKTEKKLTPSKILGILASKLEYDWEKWYEEDCDEIYGCEINKIVLEIGRFGHVWIWQIYDRIYDSHITSENTHGYSLDSCVNDLKIAIKNLKLRYSRI